LKHCAVRRSASCVATQLARELLQRLDASAIRTQALVLCPTRELADQVGKAVRRLAIGIPNVKLSVLTGGTPIAPQLASLTHAPHIVVGTPGRIQELLAKGALDPAGIRTLVLDEADRMLDMGFEEAIAAIVAKLPSTRQGLLFSATWPESIRALARRSLREPVEVAVEVQEAQPLAETWFFEVEPERKTAALAALLLQHRPESTVVFCNMRRDADEVAATLNGLGFTAAALHGDLEQRDRDEVLVRFANRSLPVLVASDVAARGLDVKELACVVNFELPSDADTYLHRVGRTARAGAGGLVLNLIGPREMPRALALESSLGIALRWGRASPITATPRDVPRPTMRTLRLDAGRSDKLRPGDILGALTGAAGLPFDAIGKIDLFPTRAFVAVRRGEAEHALKALNAGKIKGKSVRVRAI